MPVRLVWSWTTSATLPSPPISSAILSAASAAAATLSVVAVVSGMSLSTPESKAMTGMPASCACCSSGIAAWLSSAAKPMASGLLGERGGQHVDLAVDLALAVRTFEGDARRRDSAAAFSAPAFTACQNWCWKPFEMSGDVIVSWAAARPAAGEERQRR